MPQPLFTVGYEGKTVDELLDALKGAGIELLIDVRAVAASRRPGFSKTALAGALAEQGIDYLHLRPLGTPKAGREAARKGRIAEMRHPAADRDDLTLVHVTHFNALFWDAGSTRTRVIEHGIVDPGERYTGELPHAAVVINEANRRARVTGTDLLGRFAQEAPVDLFGMDARNAPPPVQGIEDLPQDALHPEMARRRVYLHPIRWTSLGLSLLEAMHLGMPVVAVGATEVHEAVPPEAGVVSTKMDVLAGAVRRLVQDADEARERGAAARSVALERYGLRRFLADWDELLEEVTA